MKIIASLFLIGMSFGFGPCLASCGPIIISYIAGTRKNIQASMATYALFSAARVAVYLLLGLLVFYLGKFITQAWVSGITRYIFITGGAFIIFLGVFTALGRRLEFKYCRILEKNFLGRYHASAIILGLITGILPCAPLLVLLGYVGLVSKTWVQALVYCLAFGLGTVISPLLVLSALAGLLPRFLLSQKAIYYRIIAFICGLIMIFLGVNLMLAARY